MHWNDAKSNSRLDRECEAVHLRVPICIESTPAWLHGMHRQVRLGGRMACVAAESGDPRRPAVFMVPAPLPHPPAS